MARVRESATEVLVAILRALNASENPELAQNLVRIVVEAQAMDGKLLINHVQGDTSGW